jgi:hypothetical protein
MNLQNTYVSRQHRYALGVEAESGHHFAALPVTNQLADYIESHRVCKDEYLSFLENPTHAREFIESCRRREQDDRLFLQPDRDRGTPV